MHRGRRLIRLPQVCCSHDVLFVHGLRDRNDAVCDVLRHRLLRLRESEHLDASHARLELCSVRWVTAALRRQPVPLDIMRHFA